MSSLHCSAVTGFVSNLAEGSRVLLSDILLWVNWLSNHFTPGFSQSPVNEGNNVMVWWLAIVMNISDSLIVSHVPTSGSQWFPCPAYLASELHLTMSAASVMSMTAVHASLQLQQGCCEGKSDRWTSVYDLCGGCENCQMTVHSKLLLKQCLYCLQTMFKTMPC